MIVRFVNASDHGSDGYPSCGVVINVYSIVTPKRSDTMSGITTDAVPKTDDFLRAVSDSCFWSKDGVYEYLFMACLVVLRLFLCVFFSFLYNPLQPLEIIPEEHPCSSSR